jgi:hypothetical protein
MSHLIFTLDFHEIVRGQLKPGCDCLISYDPLRIASAIPDYVHGSPDFEFTAYISFLPGEIKEVKLYSEVGWTKHNIVENDGTGSMLTGTFTLPASINELVIWFSMKARDGMVFYDSKQGANFHFRIESQDIQINSAVVTRDEVAGVGIFKVTVSSSLEIDSVLIRYRITNSKEYFNEIPVNLNGEIEGEKKQWDTGNIEVPYGAVIVYDLIYYNAGRKYKAENNGRYYNAEIA